MEIIKHGKCAEKEAIFTCKTCGCVFKADKLECDSKYDEGGIKLLITGCPECGAMCSVYVSAVKALRYQDLRKMDGKIVWLVSMHPMVYPGKYTVKNLPNNEVDLLLKSKTFSIDILWLLTKRFLPRSNFMNIEYKERRTKYVY